MASRGFGAMKDKARQKEIARAGGLASAKSRRGAAGSTEAASRGGRNSRRGTES